MQFDVIWKKCEQRAPSEKGNGGGASSCDDTTLAMEKNKKPRHKL